MSRLLCYARCQLTRLAWLPLVFSSMALANSGDGLSLLLGDPHCIEAEVMINLQVEGLFSEEVINTINSGLPATLIYKWELWRHRSSWWDRRVDTGFITCRVFYDVLEETYDIFNHSGKPIASCHSIKEVELIICQNQEMKLSINERLQASQNYYIGIDVRLETLDEDELENLESWLRGDSGHRESKDLLIEITRQATEVIRNVTGSGVRLVSGQSVLFEGCE